MSCLSCGKGLSRFSGSTGPDYLSCLRRSIGLGPGKWDEDAHAALYKHLASMVDVQSDRSMSSDEIRTIPFGSEPDVTAFYVNRYPTRYLTSGDAFWNCLGETQANARLSMESGSGNYYKAAMSASAAVNGTELGGQEGAPKPRTTSPVLVGAIVIAALFGVGILVLGSGR